MVTKVWLKAAINSSSGGPAACRATRAGRSFLKFSNKARPASFFDDNSRVNNKPMHVPHRASQEILPRP